MPFGFGGPLSEPMSVRRHRSAAKLCRDLADNLLKQAIESGDDEFLDMAIMSERDALAHERAAEMGGLRR